MSDSALEARRKALEESYFEKKNREALELLAKEVLKKEKLSPVSSEPLKETIMHGIVVYICEKSKGVWVEANELERLFSGINADDAKEAGVRWDIAFFNELSSRAKSDTPHGAVKAEIDFGVERKSPVTGKIMLKIDVDGVVLDRCDESGGIWFDANELEEIIQKAKSNSAEELITPDWVRSFFKAIGYK